jgi:hypothetical protein
MRLPCSLPAVDEQWTLRGRLVRRGTRRTNRLVPSRLSVALILAAIGPMIGAVFVTARKHAGQIIGAGLLGTVALLVLGLPILGYERLQYRINGYGDHDRTAHHDDSAPDYLVLTLVSRKSPGAFASVCRSS